MGGGIVFMPLLVCYHVAVFVIQVKLVISSFNFAFNIALERTINAERRKWKISTLFPHVDDVYRSIRRDLVIGCFVAFVLAGTTRIVSSLFTFHS